MKRDLIVWKVSLVLLEADLQEEREANRIVVHSAEGSDQLSIFKQFDRTIRRKE